MIYIIGIYLISICLELFRRSIPGGFQPITLQVSPLPFSLPHPRGSLTKWTWISLCSVPTLAVAYLRLSYPTDEFSMFPSDVFVHKATMQRCQSWKRKITH